MSHFYGSMKGSRTKPVTVCGHKTQGIDAHIRGWDIGVQVVIHHDEKANKDFVTVYLTGGSNAPNDKHEVFSAQNPKAIS